MNKFSSRDFADLEDIQRFFESVTEGLKDLSKTYQAEISKIRKEASTLRTQQEQVNASTATGREENTRMAREADKLARTYQKLQEAEAGVNKELVRAQEDLKQVNRLRRLEAKQNLASAGSYDDLSAQLSILKIRYKQLTEEEIKNTKEGKALTERINDINESLKRLDANVGVHSRNVGNYSQSIKEALGELNQMPGALGRAAGGVEALGQQFKALLRNPVVLALAAIVGALSALFSAFKNSESGAQLLAKAGNTVSAVFNTLTGIVNGAVQAVTKFTDNPGQGLRKLGKSIVDFVVAPFKLTIDLIGAAGAAISGDLTGAVNKANQAWDSFTDDSGIKLLTNGVKDFTAAVRENFDALERIRTLRLSNARATRQLTLDVAQLAGAEAELKAIADDTTRSFAQRESAAAAASAKSVERAQKELEIARLQNDLLNQQVSQAILAGKERQDLLDQQTAAAQAVIQAENELTISIKENEKLRSELKQERLDRDLDILIDGFDNQKAINERLLQDDRMTLEKRQEILEETVRLANDSFTKQIETIQQFTGIQVNANELIAESDAVVLNQKIRSLGLSVFIEGRLLEIIRERRTAVQDLTEDEQALNDAIRERNARLAVEQIRQQEELARLTAVNAANELKQRRENSLAFIEIDLAEFDKLQELAESRFNLTKRTEEKKTEFRLKAERDRLAKIIELNALHGGDLTEQDLEILRNRIQALDNELAGIGNRFNLFDLLGVDDPEKRNAFQKAIQFAVSQIQSFIATLTQAADRQVESADRAVAAAQRQFDIQEGLAARGEANNRERALRELQAAERNQERALRRQERAQRRQVVLNSILEASNLRVAVTEALKLGPILGPIAAGLMVGAFIASKAQAIAATRPEEFADGDLSVLEGDTHGSKSKGVYIGKQRGREQYAEGGEARMILSRQMTRRYMQDGTLPAVFHALKSGEFHNRFQNLQAADRDLQQMLFTNSTTDTSRMESYLRQLVGQNEQSDMIHGNVRIQKRRNWTTRTVIG